MSVRLSQTRIPALRQWMCVSFLSQMSARVTDQVCTLFIPVAVRDPIPLRHFGKREMLQKIDLMEDCFGRTHEI